MKQKTFLHYFKSFAAAGLLFAVVSCQLLPTSLPAETQPTTRSEVSNTPSLTPETAPIATGTRTSPPSTRTPGPTIFTPTPIETTPTPRETNPVAEIKPDSQVRRLNAAVFAGMTQPLPQLTNNQPLLLEPGGLVTTDTSGEAEIVIQNCLKLFVFQNSELKRTTCRKSDAASGLGVCGTSGMTGVVNNCSSQVDIQTPSSGVTTQGTWFSVIYLEPDQLSIVQVYEGSVDVNAVVNRDQGRVTRGQKIDEGNLWFSSPGDEAPIIGGISGREMIPMEAWAALRPELIQKYPQLDLWMQAADDQANRGKLNFYEYLLVPLRRVTLSFSGTMFTNKNVQQGLAAGIPWTDLVFSSWSSEVNVTPMLKFSNETIADARLATFNPDQARELIGTTGYQQQIFQMVLPEGTGELDIFVQGLQENMLNLGLTGEIIRLETGTFQNFIQNLPSSRSGNYIWFEMSDYGS